MTLYCTLWCWCKSKLISRSGVEYVVLKKYPNYVHALPCYEEVMQNLWIGNKNQADIRAGYKIIGNTILQFLSQYWKCRFSKDKTMIDTGERKHCKHTQRLLASVGVFSSRIIHWMFSFLSVGWMMQPLIDITCLVYCRLGLNDKTERKHWGLYS